MKIELRQANLNDLEEMQILFVDTIKSTCKNDYNKEQINVWTSSVKNMERWKSILSNQYFIIAEVENKIVGYGSLENGNYIDFMYVHKDYLRQGIANLLFKSLKKKSIKLGFDSLTSDVSITARPFFETKGFRIIKENKNVIKGVEIINYKMSE